MCQTRLICLIAIGSFVSLGGATGSPGDGDSGGFTVREELKDQFTIALPEGWSVYDQGAAQGNVMGVQSWAPGLGMVIFSAEEIGDRFSGELAARIDTGEVPSFFVDRLPRFQGSSCAGFRGKAETRVQELVLSTLAAQIRGKQRFRDVLRGHFNPPWAFVESKGFGGCIGVSSEGEGPGPSGKPRWKVRVQAASDENITYLFTLRNTEENFAKNIDIFERAIATVRLSVLQADLEALAKVGIGGLSSKRRDEWTNIWGKVENRGSTTVDWVKVGCNWLDSSGQVRGTDFTFAVEPGKGLAPGKSSGFEMTMRDKRKMAQFRCYVMGE